MTGQQEDALLAGFADYLDMRGPGTPVAAETTIEAVARAMTAEESDIPPMETNENNRDEVATEATPTDPKSEAPIPSASGDTGLYTAPSGKKYPRKVGQYTSGN